MATALFVILHFLGYTSTGDEWFHLTNLLALDTISGVILYTGLRLKR